MQPTAHRSPLPRSTGLHSAKRSALWVVGPLATAILLTPFLTLAGAATDWIAAAWLAAMLWAIAASFVEALRQGLRHGDWSAFFCWELPRNDDDLDFSTGTGAYAYRRIQRQHEALMRESHGPIESHGLDLVP